MTDASRPTPAERAAHVWPVAVLVLAGVAAYANSFRGPFVFDDQPTILENPTIRSFATAWAPPLNGTAVVGRPLVNLTLAFNYAIGDYDPFGYHVVNLVIHLLAALTLYGVIRRSLARFPARFPAGAPQAVAFGSALLWTVHPLQTESVTFIVQRTESLAGLFLLLTLYAFIRGIQSPGTPRRWEIAAVLACFVGVATKELMVVAPVLVWLYDRAFVSGSFGRALRQRSGMYAGLCASWLPLAWLVLSTGANRGGTSGFTTGVVTPWYYLLTQCEAIVMYLKLALWPEPLVVDYGIGVVTKLADVWPQALLLVALATAGAIAVWRKPAWGFFAAWFFAILAPSSSIVPLATQTMAEHRMYLPLAAITTATALGVHALLRTRSMIVWAAIGVVLVGLTWRRNEDYASGVALWTDTIEKMPHNARAHNNLGKQLYEAGRLEEAFARFLEAERLNPTAPDTQANLGLYYERVGRADRAEAHYREAIRLYPPCAPARINLGALLRESGRIEEAVSFLQETVELLPTHAEAHINLGAALLDAQRAREAIAPLRQAVQLAPDNAKAHGNLANAFALSGELEEATEHYETSLRLNPDYAIAHENYGLLLLNIGRPREAAAHFEVALRANPNNPALPARLNYARQQAEMQAP